MFHKVLYRNFSGEVKITDIFMWQIWSGLYAANFIGIMQVLWKIWQKHFGTLFIVIFLFLLVCAMIHYWNSHNVHDVQVLQGSVETLLRWGGQHYNCVTTNILKDTIPITMKIRQFFYGFIWKIKGCHFFGPQCILPRVVTTTTVIIKKLSPTSSR